MATTYFVLYSKTSRAGVVGLRPQVTWMFEAAIIEMATTELHRAGETLEDIAGIGWIEDEDGNIMPSRELSREEEFTFSVETLNDDGRLFRVFNTDADGAAEFIDAAQSYGLDDDARAIVAAF